MMQLKHQGCGYPLTGVNIYISLTKMPTLEIIHVGKKEEKAYTTLYTRIWNLVRPVLENNYQYY